MCLLYIKFNVYALILTLNNHISKYQSYKVQMN